MGTFHVLEAARLFAVPQVLFASSIGTYGDDLGDGPLDDTDAPTPDPPVRRHQALRRTAGPLLPA